MLSGLMLLELLLPVLRGAGDELAVVDGNGEPGDDFRVTSCGAGDSAPDSGDDEESLLMSALSSIGAMAKP